MSFVRSVGWTFLTKTSVTVVGIAASIIVARYLGPHDKGILAAVTALVGIALQFGNIGLPNATTFFISQSRAVLPQLLTNSIIGAVTLGGLMGGIAYLAAYFFPSLVGEIPVEITSLSLLAIPFMFFGMLAQNILIGLGKIRTYNLIDFFGNLLSAIVAVSLVIIRPQAEILLVAGTIVAIILAIIYYFSLTRTHTWAVDRSLFQKMIGYGFRSYLATLFAYLVIRSDLLLVTAMLGTTETGIYSVAAFAVDALYLFSATTGAIFFPIATAQAAQRDHLTAKIVRILGLIMVGILLLGGLVAWYFIPLLYGEAYAGAVAPTLILLPGIFFLSLETILMNNFASRGLPIQAILVIVAGFFVNLILNLIFIPLFGINGAAVASTIAYGSMFIGALVYFMRLSRLPWQEILIPRRSDFLDMMTQIRHQVKKAA